MSEETPLPRFPKPKILLVDLPDGTTSKLLEAGFNVRSGTFGRPYRFPIGDGYLPVFAQARLPNYTEQEVVIVDLTPPEPTDKPEGLREIAEGERNWYATTSRGEIDPRPMTMAMVSEDWKRVLDSGGLFVVFAQPRLRQTLVLATARYRQFNQVQELPHDNWSFLPIFDHEWLTVERDHGTESVVPESVDFMEQFFRSHQEGLEFEATLSPAFRMNHDSSGYTFFPLCRNKYGDCIGGAIVTEKPSKGRILILPQFRDKERAVYELVTTVLPEMGRHLFPDFEGDRWVRSDVYEHPSILERKATQRRLREEAEAKIAALDKEIVAERDQFGFLHGILTKTGEDLVADVAEALRCVGFAKIETPAEEEGANKQEDLQLHDRLPVLLLEVKGIAGLPTEGDTQQVTKYVVRRMKQWKQTEVVGVFVVNHQRNLPALDRDHENVFTPPQIEDAFANGTCLITTWDLFRLLRGMAQWGWPGQVVRDALYGVGRLAALPSHYAPAGTVAHYYTDISVLSVDVGETGLRVGATVAFLFPSSFFEEKIVSVEVNRKRVPEALPGQRAGYKTTLKRKDVPVGTTIYVVRYRNGQDGVADRSA